jgi:hypothetical protein
MLRFLAECVLLLALLGVDSPSIDYQKAANDAKWSWSDEQASPVYSISQSGSDYDVTIGVPGNNRRVYTYSIGRNGKSLYRWLGHRATVFRILDHRLIYADWNPGSSGGKLVAFDLLARRKIWEAPLQALGPSEHSSYRNQLNLEAGRDVVTIFGKESRGRYYEIKDATTGETVGHKVFGAGDN